MKKLLLIIEILFVLFICMVLPYLDLALPILFLINLGVMFLVPFVFERFLSERFRLFNYARFISLLYMPMFPYIITLIIFTYIPCSIYIKVVSLLLISMIKN